jgi:hypothetical protein
MTSSNPEYPSCATYSCEGCMCQGTAHNAGTDGKHRLTHHRALWAEPLMVFQKLQWYGPFSGSREVDLTWILWGIRIYYGSLWKSGIKSEILLVSVTNQMWLIRKDTYYKQLVLWYQCTLISGCKCNPEFCKEFIGFMGPLSSTH